MYGKSINEVTLMGHVGGDPSTTSFENGKSVTNISIATNESWTNKNGEKQEKTEWHNISFYFEKAAKNALEYIKKGDLVLVKGKIRYYTHNEAKRVDIAANYFQIIESRNKSTQESGQTQPNSQAAQPTERSKSEPVTSQTNWDDGDDLPF